MTANALAASTNEEIASCIRQGEALLEQGKLKESEQAYLQAIALGEQQGAQEQVAVAYRLLGELYGARRQLDKALEYLRQAIRRNTALDHRLNLMKDYQCLMWWLPYMETFREAESLFLRILSLNGESAGAEEAAACHAGLGQVYLNQKAFDLALKEFEQALQEYKSLGDKTGMGNQCIGMGLTYWAIEDQAQAMQWIQRAIDQFLEAGARRRLDHPYGTLANMYSGEDNEQALQYQRRCCALLEELGVKVHLPVVYMGLSFHLKNLKRYDEAEEILYKALRLAEEMALPYHALDISTRLADLYLTTGHPEWAEEELYAVLEGYKRLGEDINIARAYMALGNLKAQTQRTREARNYYAQAQLLFWKLGKADFAREVGEMADKLRG
jgi:tetratricopeptide (TPR) repeat protein